MIEEIYCSFEQAKALKELGFPTILNASYSCYDEKGTLLHNCPLKRVEGVLFNFKTGEQTVLSSTEYLYAPTLSLAQKWLREEKDLFIDIYLIRDTIHLYSYLIYKLIGSSSTIGEGQGTDYATYEDALSAGIDKCIELLKQ